MKKIYQLCLAAALIGGGNLAAQAIDRPTTPAGMPVDGQQYVLVNACSPTGYMSRTSWDGALYFLGATDSKYADYAFTAQQNAEDNTWSFYYVVGTKEDGVTDSLNYLAIPNGTGNLNAKNPELTKWTISKGSINGFYNITAGEGNTEATVGLKLHLNAGAQYFVISEEVNGGSWYPDYAGGTIPASNDHGFEVDENGRAIMADSTSENWAFILVNDVPEHMAKYATYNTINSFEETYLATPDYETGFQATLTAVTAVYNAMSDNWRTDSTTIAALINNKVALYEAIEKAKAIENADETLTAAIATAQEAFTSKTDATEVAAATETLNTAVNNFNLSAGDMTSRGTNMSFEDLSAQNGQTTAGLANPPIGWTMTIEGDTVTTVTEVQQHGINNWCGVNEDCTGSPKDGNQGFGIWTNAVPEFELSQTVTNLDNGTYVVSAGLMVGANNYGSRRTTQRIFGNFNSTYFASEGEYDQTLLAENEVKTYQNLEEPVTDTELQPVQVRAYVYDGTLTFGVRTNGDYKAALRTSANGNGGDGWFKVDNFHLQYEGYVGADAAAVANHFIEKSTELVNNEIMQVSLSDEVKQILKNTTEVNSESNAEDINQIIISLSSKMTAMQSSIKAYEKLQAALEEGYTQYENYQYNTGSDEYLELLQDAQGSYDAATIDETEIDNIIDSLNAKLDELKKAGIAVDTYLDIIKNPSFEDLSAQNDAESTGSANPPAGWDLTLNGVKCTSTADYSSAGASIGWCAINSGDAINEVDANGTAWTTQYTDGTHLWGIWAATMPEVELSQTFTGIPNGTYTLSCDMVVQHDWAGVNLTTQRIFANNFIQMYGAEDAYAEKLNDTEDMAAARLYDETNPDADLKHLNYAGYDNSTSYGSTSCPYPMSLTFGVSDGNLTIGFRTNNIDTTGAAKPHDGAGWFKLDNFKLYYKSEDVPTSMKHLSTDGQQKELVGQQFYSVGGARLAQPQKGITIVKNLMSDGSVKVTKILK